MFRRARGTAHPVERVRTRERSGAFLGETQVSLLPPPWRVDYVRTRSSATRVRPPQHTDCVTVENDGEVDAAALEFSVDIGRVRDSSMSVGDVVAGFFFTCAI